MKTRKLKVTLGNNKKTEKIKDDNFNLSFVKISKNLNLGQMMKKSTSRASASRAKKVSYDTLEIFY